MPRARKDKADELATADVDMTPMIDVIFNLIIFFMLVNQLVQQERAELTLPTAAQVEEEKVADKNRIIVNVHKAGNIDVGGTPVTWAELSGILLKEARSSYDEQKVPSRSVLIRGDVKAPYKNIQRVLQECANQRIYKISFVAKKE